MNGPAEKEKEAAAAECTAQGGGRVKGRASGKAPSRPAPGGQKPGTAVYIGPDIPGTAARYAVYNNGLPEPLEAYIREHPAFRPMVVPLGRLAQAKAELDRPGSAASVLFRKACEAMAGDRNKKERGGNRNGL